MTFYEVLTSTLMKVWGDTVPPTSSMAYIQQLISDNHKKIQKDYNFWFQRAFTFWPTVVGSQTYGVPVGFKELISTQFKIENEDYFKDPLSPLKIKEPYGTQWNENQEPVEYPNFFELQGDYITIYPPPSEIRTLHFIYWSFFARPVEADWVEATTTEDSVTEHAGELISYMSASDYSLIMKEYDQAKVYNEKAQDLMFDLKREDHKKRQSPLEFIRYEVF